ncbi:hypothetical protein ACHAWF_012274 [Thalassiosira exigua]
MLSMFERVRQGDEPVKNWVQSLIECYEGSVHIWLGQSYLKEKTTEGYQAACTHFEKARDIGENIKHDGRSVHRLVDEAKIEIEKLELKCMGSDVTPDELIKAAKAEYDFWATGDSREQLYMLHRGNDLAISLLNGSRVIEAQRLSMKLLAISKQVHGLNHDVAINLTSCLQYCKVRLVSIPSMNEGDKVDWYKEIHYEEDGKICVVQGPTEISRNIAKEKTFKVGANEIILARGTPVICKTTANGADGKVGEARDWDDVKSVYEVHFEDKGLDPCWMKHELLKILFELPEISE